MKTIYKADSIRISNRETKLPTDVGRFRPIVRQHVLRAVELDTGLFGCSLPFGSFLGGECKTADEALSNGLAWAAAQGWTQDHAQAKSDATAHASVRKNAHPNR